MARSEVKLVITTPSFMDSVLTPKAFRLQMGKCLPEGRYERTYVAEVAPNGIIR